MEATQDIPDACRMLETDDEGQVNLCCCYIMDADGNIESACLHPVECCC